MVKWIAAAILLLPVAELAAFIAVASVLGLGWALLLMLATTIGGIAVLRRAGRSGLAQFRVAVADPNVAGLEAHAGVLLTILGGLLLVLPGFITDVIGAAMLLGPVRRWCGLTLRRATTGGRAPDDVVDLAPGEWRQVSDRAREIPRKTPDKGEDAG